MGVALSTGLLVYAPSEGPPTGVTAGLGAFEAAAVILGDIGVYGVPDEDTIGVSWWEAVHVQGTEGVAA